MSAEERASAVVANLERGSRPIRRRLWGVSLASLAVVALSTAMAGGLLPAVVFGVLILAIVARNARHVRLTALLTGARNELARGDLAVADHIASTVGRQTTQRAYRRAVATLEGNIALRRGRLDDAIAHLDRAAEIPRSRVVATERVVIYHVRGLRALAHAMRGDEEAARADIAWVRNAATRGDFGWRVIVNDINLGEPLARAALAEMVLAGRRGELEALRRCLAENRELVAERVNPRERVLLRAMERRARAEAASVYRTAQAPAEVVDENEPDLSEWIERVLPEARSLVHVAAASAPSVPSAASAPSAPHEAPSGSNVAAPFLQRRRGLALRRPLIVFGILLVAGVLAGVELVQPSSGRHGARAVSGMEALLGLNLLPVLLAMGGFLYFYSLSRQVRRLNAAFRRIVFERGTGGDALASVSVGSNAFLRAAKGLSLSRSSYGRGGFQASLEHAEDALGAMARHRQSPAFVEFLPAVSAMRATALAALGREVEAQAEVAALPATYSARAAAETRVAILAAVRSHDWKRAADIAATITDDVPLDLRTEMLVDLVRATHGAGLAPLDLERLRHDVQQPAERAFFIAVAPELLDALEPRDSDARLGTSTSAEEERERQAEEEAEPERMGLQTKVRDAPS